MKRIIFMRHGYLEGKYANYSGLKFEELEELLLKKVHPDIDVNKTRNFLNTKKELRNVDFIISSDETRAVQTTKLVKDIVNSNFEKSSLLREVDFYEGVIGREDVGDFNNLRIKILTQFYHSNNTENFRNAIDRLLEFLTYVKTLNHDTILCVTHGWFMRLVQIYSIKNTLENVSLKELLEAKVPNFLDTITIDFV